MWQNNISSKSFGGFFEIVRVDTVSFMIHSFIHVAYIFTMNVFNVVCQWNFTGHFARNSDIEHFYVWLFTFFDAQCSSTKENVEKNSTVVFCLQKVTLSPTHNECVCVVNWLWQQKHSRYQAAFEYNETNAMCSEKRLAATNVICIPCDIIQHKPFISVVQIHFTYQFRSCQQYVVCLCKRLTTTIDVMMKKKGKKWWNECTIFWLKLPLKRTQIWFIFMLVCLSDLSLFFFVLCGYVWQVRTKWMKRKTKISITKALCL